MSSVEHIFNDPAEALQFCKNAEGIQSCKLHCGTVNKMLFHAADANDIEPNDGHVQAATASLDYENTNCGTGLYSDPDVQETSDGNGYEWAQAADGAVGVKVGQQHYYFENIATWESDVDTIQGSRAWCSAQGTCERVGCLQNVTLDTVTDVRSGSWSSTNVNPSCDLTSDYLTPGTYVANQGGYQFGDAGQNEQKWLVIQAEMAGSGGSKSTEYHKYGCGGSSCADKWANDGKAFCETHDCNWVRVHNVAPGVTESNGEITDWYTNHQGTTHLFKENHDSSLGTDNLESNGNVKRESVVVVTTIGDTVEDTPDATAANGPKEYRMETGTECKQWYNGKGGNDVKNFWPNLGSHFFGSTKNYGSYTDSVSRHLLAKTTSPILFNASDKQQQCSNMCAGDTACAGYYMYRTHNFFTQEWEFYCSLLRTDVPPPGDTTDTLYKYVQDNRSNTNSTSSTQYGYQLCLKKEI